MYQQQQGPVPVYFISVAYQPQPYPDSEKDAEALYKSMKGIGTDEKTIIDIIGHRTRSELAQIDTAFRAKFGRLLVDKVKSEFSGKVERVLVNVVQPPAVTDAIYLHDAMSGAGTNETILNEILATRTGEEIHAIKLAYVELYRNGLEQAIKGDASGDYEDLCIALLNGPRGREGHAVDAAKAAADAKLLESQPTDSNFIFVLGNASHEQNVALAESFKQQFGKSLIDYIKKKKSGHFEDLLVAVATPKQDFLANVAHKAMKGLGTDDDTLIRVITTRFGVDLDNIERAFQRLHGKSLYGEVKSETSGDYQKILLGLVSQ